MLTAYVVATIVGGLLVALSALTGLGHDASHDLDSAGTEHDLAHPEPASTQAPALDVAEGALAGAAPATSRTTRRNPLSLFLSLRFWTFGGCFFGLTGTALTLWTKLGEPFTGLLSTGLGVVVGAATALVVRRLRAPVGATRTRDQWIGRSGTLLFALSPERASKMRIEREGGATHELLVAPSAQNLWPAGTRVVVLELDDEGRARVEREELVFGPRDTT